jgi:hypothetical protein
LQQGIAAQRGLAAAITVADAGSLEGELLSGQGDVAALMAVAGVRAVGLPLVAGAAELRDLILQELHGHEQAEFGRQPVQALVHGGEGLVTADRVLPAGVK